MLAPPFEAGADHDTERFGYAYETVTPVGAPGVVMATVVSVEDHPEVPVLFTAATRKS